MTTHAMTGAPRDGDVLPRPEPERETAAAAEAAIDAKLAALKAASRGGV